MIKMKETDFTVNKWSGGITNQLAIGPEDASFEKRDFDWRISSAVVELPESDFTFLPDYMRYISTISGNMELSHPEGHKVRLTPGDVYYFDGAEHTHSAGKCTDLNLMLRKGSDIDGGMENYRLYAGNSLELAITADSFLIISVVSGCGIIYDENNKTDFSEGDFLYKKYNSESFIIVKAADFTNLLVCHVSQHI